MERPEGGPHRLAAASPSEKSGMGPSRAYGAGVAGNTSGGEAGEAQEVLTEPVVEAVEAVEAVAAAEDGA